MEEISREHWDREPPLTRLLRAAVAQAESEPSCKLRQSAAGLLSSSLTDGAADDLQGQDGEGLLNLQGRGRLNWLIYWVAYKGGDCSMRLAACH